MERKSAVLAPKRQTSAAISFYLAGTMTLANTLMTIIMSFLVFAQIESAGSSMSILRVADSAIIGPGGSGKTRLRNLIALNLILGVIVTALGMIFTRPILSLSGAEGAILNNAERYLRIIFAGSLFVNFTQFSNMIMRGEGLLKQAMIYSGGSAILNIILDPILISALEPYGMGIEGAAYATVIAQIVYAAAMPRHFRSKSKNVRIHGIRVEKGLIPEIFGVGFSAMLMQGMTLLQQTVLYHTTHSYGGDDWQILLGAALSVQSFTMIPLWGASQGFQPAAGTNYGAKQYDRVRQITKAFLAGVTILSLIFYIPIQLGAETVLSRFIKESRIVSMGATDFRVLFSTYIFLGLAAMPDAVIEGDHRAIYPFRNESGEGTITIYEVFPGVSLAYNDFHMRYYDSEFCPGRDLLCIDHCREGRLEYPVKGNAYSYVEVGDLKLDRRLNHTGYFEFPLSHYHGTMVSFDLDTACQSLPQEMRDFPVDPRSLREKYRKDIDPAVIRAVPSIEHIFGELYAVPEKIKPHYFKVKVLELLLYLDALELPESREEKPYFYKSQVEKVKAIQVFLASHMDESHTQQALAARFDIPLTTMKRCFKSVFGASMGDWLTQYRMNQAAVLPRTQRTSAWWRSPDGWGTAAPANLPLCSGRLWGCPQRSIGAGEFVVQTGLFGLCGVDSCR